MTANTALLLLDGFTATIWLSWVGAAIIRRISPSLGKRDIWQALFFELRPFIVPALVIQYIADVAHDGNAMNPGRIFALVMCILGWWVNRHDKDDDDRWKRRKQRVTERIQQVGGRLVVQPARSS